MLGKREHFGAAHEALRRTHETLTRQFHESIVVMSNLQREKSSLQTIASWALRVSATGWATVRDGKMTFTNHAFDALDRGSLIGPGWEPFAIEPPANPGATASRSLRGVVAEEARLLLAGPERGRRMTRFMRGGTVVEVLVERPVAPGEHRVVLVLVRDVTEMVDADRRVAALQGRLIERERAGIAAELAVGIAHDLGNLVGALRAYVTTLPRAGTPTTTINSLQAIIAAQAALVHKLQSVAQPSTEPIDSLDLRADVIQPAAQMVEPWLGMGDEKKGRVSIRIHPSVAELPRIAGPREGLINMLINIFLNARDAMAKGGTINLVAEQRPGLVVLRVEDEGVGIAGGDLKRIFEPLFSTKGKDGTGMGLATAAALMRRLGGSIVASNRAAGGACLEICFVLDASAPGAS